MLEPREIAVTSVDERFIAQTLEVIEKNMSEQDFSVEQLGSDLAMSRMQLFRKIKALTDQAPSEFSSAPSALNALPISLNPISATWQRSPMRWDSTIHPILPNVFGNFTVLPLPNIPKPDHPGVTIDK